MAMFPFAGCFQLLLSWERLIVHASFPRYSFNKNAPFFPYPIHLIGKWISFCEVLWHSLHSRAAFILDALPHCQGLNHKPPALPNHNTPAYKCWASQTVMGKPGILPRGKALSDRRRFRSLSGLILPEPTYRTWEGGCLIIGIDYTIVGRQHN